MNATRKLSLLLVLGIVLIVISIMAEQNHIWGHAFLCVATLILGAISYASGGMVLLRRRLVLVVPFALSLIAMYGLSALVIPQLILTEQVAFLVPLLGKSSRLVQFFVMGAFIGLIKGLLFAVSMLGISLLLDRVTKEDIIALPFGPHTKKILLLSFVLYSHASTMIADIRAIFERLAVPGGLAQGKAQPLARRIRSKVARFREAFATHLRILLALTVYLLEEAELRGIFMDNRIKHCYSEYASDVKSAGVESALSAKDAGAER